MLFSRFLASMVWLTLSIADATSPQAWCGIEAPSEETLKSLDTLRATELVSRRSPWVRRETINIPVHFHGVIDPDADRFSTSAEKLQSQIDVLNKAYGPHGIQFTMASSGQVTDSKLAYFDTTSFFSNPDSDPSRVEYLKQTRKGGYNELNIYLYTKLGSGFNGVCLMPQANFPEKDLWRDGCHLLAGTMPGGNLTGYNIGFTAVHETGHWMGLLHPWGEKEGQCSGPGDRVDDTPVQSKPVFGCPKTPQNSCPGQAGVDNADNYMDYAEDTCYRKQKFTLGQEIRMHSSYIQLRSTHPSSR